MSKEVAPKKPLTPFFMYKDELKQKGIKITPKDAGEKWANQTEAEKKPYLDKYKELREKYDKYMEDHEGVVPGASSKKKDKSTSFKPSRVRAVCGKDKENKSMTTLIYKALGRVAVS